MAVRRLLMFPILLACAAPAAATEWINCSDGTDAVSADMLVGMLDVVAIVQARVEANGKRWATDAEGDGRIVVGQAFEGPETLVADFTDEAVANIVVSVRLFKASDEEATAYGGTLRVAGEGAWAVSCSPP